MPEEILFESESTQNRTAIADYLRQVAASLDAGDPITLRAGDQSVTLTPPGRPTFEVTAEREGPDDGPGEVSVELEIEWPEDAGDGGEEDLRIE